MVWAEGEVYLQVGGVVTLRWRRWDNLVRNIALPGSYEATSSGCERARGFADCLGALNLRKNEQRCRADGT